MQFFFGLLSWYVRIPYPVGISLGILFLPLRFQVERIEYYNTMNPDLQKERNGATFPIGELATILDGGKERSERRKELRALLEKNPTFSKVLSLFFCLTFPERNLFPIP